MDSTIVIAGAYYLLICADGQVSEKELLLGRKMISLEGIDAKKFEAAIDVFKTKSKTQIYNECVSGLKKLERKKQVRCLAWLSLIANSDGFMDREEWALIYKIYSIELGISLKEILKTQKEISDTLAMQTSESFEEIINNAT